MTWFCASCQLTHFPKKLNMWNARYYYDATTYFQRPPNSNEGFEFWRVVWCDVLVNTCYTNKRLISLQLLISIVSTFITLTQRSFVCNYYLKRSYQTWMSQVNFLYFGNLPVQNSTTQMGLNAMYMFYFIFTASSPAASFTGWGHWRYYFEFAGNLSCTVEQQLEIPSLT